MQSFGREALNSSWNSSSTAGLEIPWQEARLRGKFYDEYREKREAKLREEHAAKKAEKELAKLKALQELEELEQRKAEITGKIVAKSPEKRKFSSQSQPPPLKLQSPSKTRLSKNRKEQNKTNEDVGATTNDLHKGLSHQKGNFNRGVSGELLRPDSPTHEVLDPPKSTGGKKNSSKKTSPSSRTSKPVISPLRSPSPKPVKSKVSGTSIHSTTKRGNQSLMGEKSLTQSLSNLADVKKNSKTVSGQPGPNSTIEKPGLPSSVQNKCNRNRSGNEACQGFNLNHCKEEKKNPNQPRKALNGDSDSNSLSRTNSEESTLTSKPSSFSKGSNKSSGIPLDSKPFLRKGSGIGSGSGRVASRVKLFSHGHSSKPSEDEVPAYERNTKERVEESRISEPYEFIEGATEQKKPDQMESDTVISADASGELYEPERNMQSMAALSSASAVSEDSVHQHEISNSDKDIPSVSEVTNAGLYTPKMAESSPIEAHGHGKEINSSSNAGLYTPKMEESPPTETHEHGKEINSSSNAGLYTPKMAESAPIETHEHGKEINSSSNAGLSTPKMAESPPIETHEHGKEINSSSNAGLCTPKLAESPPIETHGHGKETNSSSKIVMSEQSMGTFSAATSLFDSHPLIDSHHISSGLYSEPVNSSSLKSHKHSFSQGVGSESDAEQNHLKCGSSQKPILVSVLPQKDAPKGLKRFLNFARRNRSKTLLPHSTSPSNLSESDESMGSLNRPSRGNPNDILQRGQVQAKDIILRSPSFNKSYDFQSMNSSVQSSLSDILKEEDLTGATVRKVPRSLFALPSFRSKGSNSKSR